MVFSSIGDWLGLLATTAMAAQLSGGSYATANFAIAGVFIARLLPAVFLGPLAGVIADRFDRRRLMVSMDLLRGALYISIPIVHTYFWLYTAMILVECLTLFWSPAKEASVPNLVPKDKLENANQVSLLAAYGTAPVAAVLFSLLSLFGGALAAISPLIPADSVYIALYINGLSFFYAAWTIRGLHEIPKGPASGTSADENIGKSLIEGWKAVASSKIIRGLIVGMVGAFSAAGAVIGLARTFVVDLGGGDAAYGVLFAAVFTGLALGIGFGPKIFAQFSRRRLFGASLAVAGFFLILLALIANLVISIFIVVILGAFSGICWVTGFTMLGMEVNNEVRGRTFAFVQSLIRITLTYDFYNVRLQYNGAQITILIAGFIGLFIGILSYRQMKDRPQVSLWSDVLTAMQGELGAITGQSTEGIFISFEGGEGTGKSTQSKLLAEWLQQEGETVTLSFEPGGTPLGKELRKILLGHETGTISSRAEALLYAADRADHVESVIRPALARGEVVINDRYMDSSIAYQGAGRVLIPAEVARINRWATETLYPTLTILIDVPAVIGLGRLTSMDRLEAEPVEFHERVRQEFLQLAMLDPERYLVIDGTASVQDIHEAIIARVAELPALKRNAQNPHSRNILRPIIAASHAVGRATKGATSAATKAAKKTATKAASKAKKPAKKQ
jgi:dTMP kinase